MPDATTHAAPPNTTNVGSPELTATQQAPSLDEALLKAMQELGITDLSTITKDQATGLLERLQQLQSDQAQVADGPSTEGLAITIKKLEQAIAKWPEAGATPLEQELNSQKGRLGVLEAISAATGHGEVGVAALVSAAQTEVGGKVSVLEKAQTVIDEQMPLGAENSGSSREQAQKMLDAINGLENAGYNLADLMLKDLQEELQNQLSKPPSEPPNPEGDDLLLRKSVLGALDNYFEASGLDQASPQRTRNRALLAGADVASNEHSMSKAWETETRNITNLESFSQENVEDAIKQLEALRADAIRRGDTVAVTAINAKISVMAEAAAHIEEHGSLGDHAIVTVYKLKAIDMGTKQILLDQLKEAKLQADQSGDAQLMSELEGKIASMQTQINTLEQELKVIKEKMTDVIEFKADKHVQSLMNVA
ncbi:hypothetical protein [Limnobacter sp.]|uniref:hypothetical protein n=1 Tax=Limnobacter sp. TaxID=2003368 RepID=UPI0035146026